MKFFCGGALLRHLSFVELLQRVKSYGGAGTDKHGFQIVSKLKGASGIGRNVMLVFIRLGSYGLAMGAGAEVRGGFQPAFEAGAAFVGFFGGIKLFGELEKSGL
jgi:hypothetical protein